MLLGVVEIEAKEGAEEELIGLINKCAEKSRKEEGCICYNLYLSQEGHSKMLLFEKWRDSEALSIHTETAHFKELIKSSAELKSKDDNVRFFEV